LKGMMNIGTRPTISTGSLRSIEVNLFDFDTEIYGRNITIFLKEKLRAEQKFAGLEALKLQIEKDREDAIRVLSGTN
ncbi:MAG: riboflavin biosynthesis protein RibF, partial [Chitinophagaceae bacterium]